MSFINAVYVDGFRRKKQFIATQVPMANTAKHFWRMIAQHNVEQVIVLQESGIEEVIIRTIRTRKICHKITLEINSYATGPTPKAGRLHICGSLLLCFIIK